MKLRLPWLKPQLKTIDIPRVHRWMITARIHRDDVTHLMRQAWADPLADLVLDPPASGPESEFSVIVQTTKAAHAEEYVRRQLARANITCYAIKGKRA